MRVKPHRINNGCTGDPGGTSDQTTDQEPPFGVETSKWNAFTKRRLSELSCTSTYYFKYSLHFVVRLKYVAYAWPRISLLVYAKTLDAGGIKSPSSDSLDNAVHTTPPRPPAHTH